MLYGKLLPEYGSRNNSRYGFVNETQIRVGAGIMFSLGFFTFLVTYFSHNYVFALSVVAFFWLDFLLKVINPSFSPIAALACVLSKHKQKIRVGSIQKRFAWSIGLVLSSIVLIALVARFLFDTRAATRGGLVRPMWICVLCLIFMRCEAILGYCV